MTTKQTSHPIVDSETFAATFDVSRETLDRLQIYVDLLIHWQKRINLIGPSTVEQIWSRHIADAAQLAFAPFDAYDAWLDLGSGAGLPGIPLAILKRDVTGGFVHLAESNGKKTAFLRTAIRETGAPARVHDGRIENLEPESLDPTPQAVTARALAPVGKLLHLASPFLKNGTPGVFFKGQDVDDELTEAAKYWNIAARRERSFIYPDGCILIIEEATRV